MVFEYPHLLNEDCLKTSNSSQSLFPIKRNVEIEKDDQLYI